MPAKLMTMPFLQVWSDGAHLGLRFLFAPQDNPLAPLAPGEPSFVDGAFDFEVRLVQGLASLPTTTSAYQALAYASPAPPDARAIAEKLAATLPIDETVAPVDPRRAGVVLRKYAPPGYREATGYSDGRNPFLVVDDTYHCAIRSAPPAGTQLKSPAPVLGWGNVFAAALRQPLLAQRLGLIREFDITPPHSYFSDGGWVYVTFAATSPGASLTTTPGALKVYAARVPRLSATPRRIFTSVQFPVADLPPTASFDPLFREVIDYDDGFAKAVYARQPHLADPLDEGDSGTRPHEDRGIQLGWDDEQVATWFNRQANTAGADFDAPMGVIGYRVDARIAGTTAWSSLVRGTTHVSLDGLDLGTTQTEFPVEIAPNKLMSETGDGFWIPSYYTRWTGTALVGPDHVARALNGIDGSAIVEGIAPEIDLRYGRDYEFRVRLVDHTAAGPGPDDEPVNTAPQPIAPLSFRRWVPPAIVRMADAPPPVPDPAAAPSVLHIERPLLTYPAYVFAGGSAADILADIPIAAAEKRHAACPDPDVVGVEIALAVAFPGEPSGYRTIYSTTRPFPAHGALSLDLDWVDCHDVAALAAPVAGPIPIPTARTARLTINALASGTTNYYGAPDVRHGAPTSMTLRKESLDERALLSPASSELVEGLFLQPDRVVSAAVLVAQSAAGLPQTAPDNALGRLAAALDLAATDTGLRGRDGQRVLFGCSSLLRHVLGPELGSVTFASLADLTLTWLLPVRMELRRDWSWDGLEYLSVSRDGVEVGRITPSRTIPHEAANAPSDHSTIVFLDAVDPKRLNEFPTELHLNYTVSAVPREPAAPVDPPLVMSIDLPITTPPAQAPVLASAGLALSDYRHDDDYSATEPRSRMLWLEFTSPPENPDDAYYCRVLANAPDPVISGDVEIPMAAEPPLPIDPEPIRTIVPGQSDDNAGAGAMQPLIPTESDRHFLVPLPEGLAPDSPQLFGFFTYELRLGHHQGWSTAQGRFGRPLRITGVQHPSPPLTCAVTNSQMGLEVSAPFADPVLGPTSVRPYPPVTELWVLLYAQVCQADGSTMRNILVSHRQATPRVERWKDREWRRADFGTATWSRDETISFLYSLGLDHDNPMSCLAVETLPGDEPVPDPVGTGLGYERFLRTSPLTAVPSVC